MVALLLGTHSVSPCPGLRNKIVSSRLYAERSLVMVRPCGVQEPVYVGVPVTGGGFSFMNTVNVPTVPSPPPPPVPPTVRQAGMLQADVPRSLTPRTLKQ